MRVCADTVGVCADTEVYAGPERVLAYRAVSCHVVQLIKWDRVLYLSAMVTIILLCRKTY